MGMCGGARPFGFVLVAPSDANPTTPVLGPKQTLHSISSRIRVSTFNTFPAQLAAAGNHALHAVLLTLLRPTPTIVWCDVLFVVSLFALHFALTTLPGGNI